MMGRGFKVVSFANEDAVIPIRADRGSAGYDFYSRQDAIIKPDESFIFDTGIKAYMEEDEVLMIYVRSSVGIKKGLRLKNGTGVIDSTYYENPSNEGNIMIVLQNTNSNKDIQIQKGERIAQGIFVKYLTADEDEVLKDIRDGGMGSSGN